MKYTLNEFAQEIRNLFPGNYDDLSNEDLVKLWLRKYPNDQEKIDLNIGKNNLIENKVVEIELTKREKLIKLLLKKYINEYLYIFVISSIVALVSYGYSLLTYSESAEGWTTYGGLFAIVSFFGLIYRIIRKNKLIKSLSSKIGEKNSDIWADIEVYKPLKSDKEVRTFVLHVSGKSYKVPEVMLPYTIEDCLDIINKK